MSPIFGAVVGVTCVVASEAGPLVLEPGTRTALFTAGAASAAGIVIGETARQWTLDDLTDGIYEGFSDAVDEIRRRSEAKYEEINKRMQELEEEEEELAEAKAPPACGK